MCITGNPGSGKWKMESGKIYMQYSKIIYPIAALLMIFMVSSCGNDPDEIEIREDGKIHVNVGVEMENTIEMTTRAQDGYSSFGGADYNGWSMGIIAYTKNGDKDIKDQGSATYSYSGSEGSWASDLWLGPATYSLYAYSPSDLTADIDVTDGKKNLVLSDIAPFGTKDILASIATAKSGETLEDGKHNAVISPGSNTVRFRMNHLLSKLKIQFQLPAGKYDDLRKIEITKVTLGSDIEKSKNYNIICDYSGAMAYTFEAAAANASEKASVDFVYAGSGESILGGKALTLSATSPGPSLYDFDNSKGEIYVIPDVINNNNMHLKMTITYNVFTKDSDTDKYVETRHQVTATNNSIVVYKNNGAVGTIEASKYYTLTVKIVPSYLYVLADDDQSSSIVLQ